MKKIGVFVCSFLFAILISSLASSFNGYGNISPSNLLENEWVMFGLIFIIFFAIVFFSLGKVMKENKGAAAVISIAISLFIAVSISRRVWFYGYFGEELSNWFMIFAVIIGIVFLINIVSKLLGGIGLFLTFGGLWYLFSKTNFSDILPYSITDSDWFEFFISGKVLGILIIALIIMLIISIKNKDVRKWFLGSKKKKSLGEILSEIGD